MVEFPFRMADITVMGYDLSENHFAQMQELYPSERDGRWADEDTYIDGGGITSDGWSYEIQTKYLDVGGETKYLMVSDIDNRRGNWFYAAHYGNDGRISTVELVIDYNHNGGKCVFDQAMVNVPVTAGESYEDWSRVMQLDRIKENDLRPEERDGRVGIWKEDGSGFYIMPRMESGEYWLFSTEGCQGIYAEYGMGNFRSCEFKFFANNSVIREEWPIEWIKVEINDGIITRIIFQSYSIIE